MIQRSPVSIHLLVLVALATTACSGESPTAAGPEVARDEAPASLAYDAGNGNDLAQPNRMTLQLSIRTGSTYPDPSRTEPCPEGRFPMRMEGEGVGGHLGSFEFSSSVCSDGVTWTEGRGALRAANGDLIHFSSNGHMTSPVHWTEDDMIDGGTGRFAHAAGELTMLGEIYPQVDEGGQLLFPVPWTGESAGWVSYEASDRGDPQRGG